MSVTWPLCLHMPCCTVSLGLHYPRLTRTPFSSTARLVWAFGEEDFLNVDDVPSLFTFLSLVSSWSPPSPCLAVFVLVPAMFYLLSLACCCPDLTASLDGFCPLLQV
ncbi:hypothetical protein ACN42_g6928 [Penicillium freii]|uniref:Uncharacterized protein n=1 Tax=Penicillium freii TaxID=48697 RepID=A0A101MGM4_PENFR|nr:hypothetical protein ACN42_g6928 [Penicillium freii]